MSDSKRLNIALKNHVFRGKIETASTPILPTTDVFVHHEILFYGTTPDIFNCDFMVTREINNAIDNTDFIEITSTGWRKTVWKFLKSSFRR